MANLNVRNAGMAAVAGALPVVLSRYGSRVPVVGRYLQQYSTPVAGVLAVAAHMLASSSQANRFGTEGLAYGGAAVLGNYATNFVLTNVLKAPAYAEARARIGGMDDMPAALGAAFAGVRAHSPAGQTMRIDI